MSVKSGRASISPTFLANSSAIACLAASFATGFTALTSATPLALAASTAS
ncbi:hypothetical protein [Streptococcus mitis]|nr:hypothetical protein [Streptococcus mitis]